MIKSYSIIVMTFLTTSTILSQSVLFEKEHFNSIKTADIENSYFIYQSGFGEVYLSSLQRLLTLAGKTSTYRSNTLVENQINVQSPFLEDNNSNVWFSTTNHLYRYNKLTDDLTEFLFREREDEDHWLFLREILLNNF